MSGETVRKEYLGSEGDAPEEGCGDLGDVVEVARETPPTRGQEQRRLLLALHGRVGGLDLLRWLAPDEAFTIGVAEELALPVRVVVDPDGEEASDEVDQRKIRVKLHIVLHEPELGRQTREHGESVSRQLDLGLWCLWIGHVMPEGIGEGGRVAAVYGRHLSWGQTCQEDENHGCSRGASSEARWS